MLLLPRPFSFSKKPLSLPRPFFGDGFPMPHRQHPALVSFKAVPVFPLLFKKHVRFGPPNWPPFCSAFSLPGFPFQPVLTHRVPVSLLRLPVSSQRSVFFVSLLLFC